MKKTLVALALTLLSALLLPLFALRAASADFFLLAALALLLIIFPVTALGLGVFAGFDPKTRWFLPALFLVLLLLSTRLFFGMYWPDVLFYLAVYLGISVVAALLTNWLHRRFRRRG